MTVMRAEAGKQSGPGGTIEPVKGAGELGRRLEAWAGRQELFVPGDRVVLAVSGGADSTALLYWLAGAAEGWGLQLAVAHFDHGWREDSAADAAWVEARARELGLPFFGARAVRGKAGANREAAARAERYAFLEEAAARWAPPGAPFRRVKVATGHTADDQAETVLLRLARGSGGTGLAGILPQRLGQNPGVSIVRPLLWARGGELRAWLRARKLEWREDATNLDLRQRRNWIRHELLPVIAGVNPKIVERLATLAEVAGEEDRFWSRRAGELASRLFHPHGKGWRGSRRELAALDRASLRRLLRELARRTQGDLRRVEFAAIEEVAEWIRGAESDGRSRKGAPIPPRERRAGRCRFRVSSIWVEIAPVEAPSGPGAGEESERTDTEV